MQQMTRRRGIQLHCEYRTRFQILTIRDTLRRAQDTGDLDETLLDLPPGPTHDVHAVSKCPEWAKGEE